jgi:5-methylcytosine-specific restriction endonuclease McrA
VCGDALPPPCKYGVCQRSIECRRENARRRQQHSPRNVSAEAQRAAARKYRQRPDRPCRYARAGCTEYAVVNLVACAAHNNADRRRHRVRARRKLLERLTAAQAFICPWCSEALHEDLHAPVAARRTVVAIDHVIPKASGVVIEEEWNLQVLHDKCNGDKGSKITPQAMALAAEHEVALPAIPNLPSMR